MIIKIYDDGCMAEIILVEAKSITADELVCTMLQHGITAAKIVHSDVIQTNRQRASRRSMSSATST